jgi:hypothetical protein
MPDPLVPLEPGTGECSALVDAVPVPAPLCVVPTRWPGCCEGDSLVQGLLSRMMLLPVPLPGPPPPGLPVAGPDPGALTIPFAAPLPLVDAPLPLWLLVRDRCCGCTGDWGVERGGVTDGGGPDSTPT